jgi:hypothetical protein
MNRFELPAGYSIVRLQDLHVSDQEKLLPLIFALAREQYPEWPAERSENWLKALHGGNENGTKMAASVVLNPDGKPEGLSALELYANGTAMINYSVASKASPHYLALIYAATKDMMEGVRALQARGDVIDFVAKEHHLNSDRAVAGYYAVGQVPIDGPTSLLSAEIKYYEVAYGDPKDVGHQAGIDHAMMLADPKTGINQDEVVHLWLIQDFIPSHPDKPLPDLLRALAESYAREHSIYRELDYRMDPGYISLHQLADHLPADATYQQAVQASARGAAKFMGLKA